MKLDYKIIDFFDIIGKKDILQKLQLLQAMKIYNIFYSNLFWKTPTDPITCQVNKSKSPVIINNEKKWEIEKILDTRSFTKKIQF